MPMNYAWSYVIHCVHFLHGVEYAAYTQEQVGSLPDAVGGRYDFMYRLTVHVSTHSAQVRSTSRPHCFRRECRRVLHGAHAVVLSHEQSITVQRTSLSKATPNYTDRHGFVQRRRRQGQRTRGTAPIHTVQFSNTFSVLSDPATAHLLHPQRRETSPPAPLQSGPVSPPHVPGATQAAALGRPHAKRTRHACSHIHDCDYIGTLNTRNLHTHSMTEVRVGALSQLMQTHCIGIMAVQETKLAGHLPEFDVFGVQYMGPPAHLQHGVPTGGTGFFVRDTIVKHVTYLGTRPQSRHRSSPKLAPVWLKVFGPTPEQDIHVASVYLPCAGCSREQYADAL